MGINQILRNAGLELQPRGKWTTILDQRSKFRQAFNTNRLGKLQDDHLYVTVRNLNMAARRLMDKHNLQIVELKTTNSRDDSVYPGFSLNQRAPATLAGFVKDLQTVMATALSARRGQ